MPRHILYAYVHGSDLDDIADALDAKFAAFVAGRRWSAGEAWAVNQRHPAEQTSHPDDLPDWDLGLNLELPDSWAERPGWFTDAEEIARFLGRLQSEFGRDFVIGIADTITGITEDLLDVSAPSPDLSELKAILGVGDIE